MHEISYLLLGRPSIFFICALQFLNNFLTLIASFIILVETVSQLLAWLLVRPADNLDSSEVERLVSEQPPLV